MVLDRRLVPQMLPLEVALAVQALHRPTQVHPSCADRLPRDLLVHLSMAPHLALLDLRAYLLQAYLTVHRQLLLLHLVASKAMARRISHHGQQELRRLHPLLRLLRQQATRRSSQRLRQLRPFPSLRLPPRNRSRCLERSFT